MIINNTIRTIFFIAILFIIIFQLNKYLKLEGFQNNYNKAIISWNTITNNTSGNGKIVNLEYGYLSKPSFNNTDNKLEKIVLAINDKNNFLYLDNGSIWKTLNVDLKKISSKNRKALIGLNSDGVLFVSENGFSDSPTWLKFKKAPSGIKLMNLGFDGYLVVVDSNNVIHGCFLNEESYENSIFERIYENKNSIKDLEVKTKDNIFIIDETTRVYKLNNNGGNYVQELYHNAKYFTKISVGSDGSSWGINKDGFLLMLNSDNQWEAVDKVNRFLDVDVLNNNNLVALTTDYNVKLGSISGTPKLKEPIESPFQLVVRSGKPSIELQVEHNDIIPIEKQGNVVFSKEQGLHVVGVNEYGQKMSHDVYKFARNEDKEINRLESKRLMKKMSSLLEDKLYVENANLVSGFFKDATASNPSKHYNIINNLNDVEIISKEKVGYYKVALQSFRKYKMKFDFKTDVDFAISAMGANKGVINEKIKQNSIDLSKNSYEIEFDTIEDGELKIYFSNLGGNKTTIKNFSISSVSGNKSDVEMVFLLVQSSIFNNIMKNDTEPKLDINLISFLEEYGFTKIKNIKHNDYYVAILNASKRYVSHEELQKDEILITSEGKTPVIDAAFNKALYNINNVNSYKNSRGEKVIIHKKDSLLWDVMKRKVVADLHDAKSSDNMEKLIDISSLPSPFNHKIDSILDLNNEQREVLLFRGNLFLKYNVKSDSHTGPFLIGVDESFPLNRGVSVPKSILNKFKNGIDSAFSFSFNNIAYLFRGSYYIVYDLSAKKIRSFGDRAKNDSIFGNLPDMFKNKIDAGVKINLRGREGDYYLFAKDKWMLMTIKQNYVDSENNNKRFTKDSGFPNHQHFIVDGPHSLVYHPEFSSLPLKYRANISDVPPEPYLNHTFFKKNAMKNYDITVIDGGIRGLAGWDAQNVKSLIDSSTEIKHLSFNNEVIFNMEKPPIMSGKYAQFLKDNEPSSYEKYKSVNDLLRYYYNIGFKKQHLAKRFGGNTVSVSLRNGKGKWQSTDGRASLDAGCFYQISIYAKTQSSNDIKFAIRPYLSYTLFGNNNKKNVSSPKVLEYKEISADDGWQLLVWDIQLDTETTFNNVSFEYEQRQGKALNSSKQIHTLYGPYVKPVLGYPTMNIIDGITGNNPVDLEDSENSIILLKSKTGRYLSGNTDYDAVSCNLNNCKSIDNVKYGSARFKITPISQENNRFRISHGYLTTNRNKSKVGGSVHIINQNDKVRLSSDISNRNNQFYILQDIDGYYMFLNIPNKKFLGINLRGSAYWKTATGNVADLNDCKFSIEKYNDLIEEGFSNMNQEIAQFIDASVPMDYVNSNYVYLFKNDEEKGEKVVYYCVYDMTNRGWISSQTKITSTSKFKRLPTNSISEMTNNTKWENYTEQKLEELRNNGRTEIPNTSFRNHIDSILPVRRNSRDVYIFSGNYYVIWNLDKDDYADVQYLDMKNHKRPLLLGAGSNYKTFNKLPVSFNKIDASMSIDVNKALLISGDFWCIWNILLHDLEDIKNPSSVVDVGKLGTGWSKNLPKNFIGNVSACVSVKGQNGRFIIFSGDSFKIVTLQKNLSGEFDFTAPALIEPQGENTGYFIGSHPLFKNLPSKFKPSKQDLCKMYLKTIHKNTSIPKTKCSANDTNYGWVNMCPYLPDNQQECVGSGLAWNKELGFCSRSGETDKKYKKVDNQILDKFKQKYESECKSISKYDYDVMTEKETSKNNKKQGELEQELNIKNKRRNLYENNLNRYKSLKNSLNEKLSDEQEKELRGIRIYDDLGNIMTEGQNSPFEQYRKKAEELATVGSQKAVYDLVKGRSCLPVRKCKSNPTTGDKLSEGCRKQINKMLGKVDEKGNAVKNPPEFKGTTQNIEKVINLFKSNIDVNNYPISEHPNYGQYIENKHVDVCPSLKQRRISDFDFGDFPESKYYIRKDHILKTDYSQPQQFIKKPSDSIDLLIQKIKNTKILKLSDLIPIVKDPTKMQRLKDYFKGNTEILNQISAMSNYETFANQDTSLDFQIKIIDLLRSYSTNDDLLNFVVEYMETQYPTQINLLKITDHKMYFNGLKNAINKFNLNSTTKQNITRDLNGLEQDQKNIINNRQQQVASSKSSIKTQTKTSEDSSIELAKLLEQVPDELKPKIKEMYETIQRLNSEKARLKRKCIDSDNMTMATDKIKMLNKHIKEYQNKIISLSKKKNCKGVSKANIPCWNCKS